MKYLIWVGENEDDQTLFSGPVAEHDQTFFENEILPYFKPISEDQYTESFCVILQTMAPYSYILFNHNLYWCIEWEPGMIVVKFSSDGKISAVALRSPVPEFGGRVPLETDLADYNEDDEDHLYNLIFDAWDAQFDEQNREWGHFEKATENEIKEYWTCLNPINNLSETIQKKYDAQPGHFFENCKNNIANWAGAGKRITGI